MIFNALVGAIGAAGHNHHVSMSADHHSKAMMEIHDAQASVMHHDCCNGDNSTLSTGCAAMVMCATHCAQYLPDGCQHQRALFFLSEMLIPVVSGSLISVDPSRHFKPPRV